MKVSTAVISAFLAILLPLTAHAASVTDAEVELLARVIYAEARGECWAGQVSVGQCALDRLEDGGFGDTLEEVLTSPNQFAAPGKLTEDCVQAAKAAVEGTRYIEGRVLFFRQAKTTRDWHAPYRATVGAHRFYGYDAKEATP